MHIVDKPFENTERECVKLEVIIIFSLHQTFFLIGCWCQKFHNFLERWESIVCSYELLVRWCRHL